MNRQSLGESLKRALAIAAPIAAIALVGSVLTAPSVTAASLCPKALKSVVGGSGDAFSNGRDDGASGEGAEYVGGEIILQLDPSVGRVQLECIADELQADIVQGGIGKRGLAGIDNTVILLLRPGRSVIKTVNLLNRGRFSNLVLHAEPNAYIDVQAIRLPNDPMLRYQWGAINQGWAPKAKDDFLGTEDREQLGPGSTASMRLPQLWDYMRRGTGVTEANPAGAYDRINVAVVDNSYFQHPELVANSDLTKGGMVYGFGGITLDVKGTNPGERYKIELGTLRDTGLQSKPLRTCDLLMRSDEEEIAEAITKSVDSMCGYDDVLIYDIVNTGLTGTRQVAGTYEIRYGNQKVNDYNPINPANTLAEDLSKILSGLPVTSQDQGTVDVSVTPLLYTEVTDKSSYLVQRIIVPAEYDEGITVDGANIVKTDTEAPASTAVRQPTSATVTEKKNISATDQANGVLRKFTIDYIPPIYLTKAYDRVFSIPDGKPVDLKIAARRVINTEGDWPGRVAPEFGSPFGGSHGVNVAGMIGATANNGVGMAGAIGPYHNIKMFGLVPAAFTVSETAEALRVIVKSKDTHVVNLSLGGPSRTKKTYTDITKEDEVDPGALMRQITSVPKDSPTLFVVAAGNEGGNVNDQNVRNDQTYKGKSRVAGEPCRPKGHAVKVRPDNGGENFYYLTQQDKQNDTNRQPVTKGGTLSYLKMPDGTYDRGNILCVGSVDWRRQPSDFTNWGRGVVDVGAPGTNILGPSSNDSYLIASGTSFAAPLVSGVAALVYTALPANMRKPWIVKCAILSSATTQPLARPSDLDLQNLPGFNYQETSNPFGAGIINDPRAGYTSGAGPHQYGPKGEMFTVNGIVNGQMAVSAAKSLARKLSRVETPTCVQQRTFFGGWKNTRTQ